MEDSNYDDELLLEALNEFDGSKENSVVKCRWDQYCKSKTECSELSKNPTADRAILCPKHDKIYGDWLQKSLPERLLAWYSDDEEDTVLIYPG